MTAHPSGCRLRTGFTVIELAIVLILVGLLVVPLLRLAGVSFGSTRDGKTQIALETARDGLIAFAAANGGCLPFAADFEGGLRNTDATGAASATYVDTGVGKIDTYAGDLPWADLGLTDSFLDGDGLRIQYYVASSYTDTDGIPGNGVSCGAGYRGIEWNAQVTYNGSGPNPIYVYYNVTPTVRQLFKIIATFPAGEPPNLAHPSIDSTTLTEELDTDILELRRGPDVTGAGAQADTMSIRNVFVLIAPGTNRNANVNRGYVRDSNHTGDAGGGPWPLNATDPPVRIKDVRFSATPNVDTTDSGNNGDDTLLVMSFIQYKAELSKFGLIMEPMCEDPPGC